MLFNAANMQCSFIKNLIQSFPLPIYKSVHPTDYLLKDNKYIYEDKFIKCAKSGYLEQESDQCEYDIVGEYDFGQQYIYTRKNVITDNYYSPQLHKYLGEYLRLVRDYKQVDLMPFYNCYSCYYVDDFYLTKDAYELKKNESVKVTLIPIKFNREYTIAVSGAEVKLLPVIYDTDIGMKKSDSSNGASYLTDVLMDNLLIKTQTKSNCVFSEPFVYKVTNTDMPYIELNERNLYLALQVSSDNDSTVVVLEGNYLDTGKNIISDIPSLSSEQLNCVMLSRLSLLQLNTRVQYPYSPRLLEYLLLNVIDSSDPISSDIERVQKVQNIEEKPLGVWNNKIRVSLYNDYMNSNYYYKFDINGFVDKDVERYLLRKEIKQDG